MADLALDARFERLRAGPDGQVDTGDDGIFPFRHPPPAFFPRPPYRYEVRVEAAADDRLDIIATGFGPAATTRRLAASVLRSPAPYVPAAVFSAATRVSLRLGADFTVSGLDDTSAGDNLPALATESAEAAQTVASALPESARDQLLGDGGPPAIGVASFPPLSGLATAAARRPDVQALGPAAAGAWGSGLFLASSSLALGNASGSGILIVDGPLTITGEFTFSGLVLVLGDVRFSNPSVVHIAGALLQGAAGSALDLRGAGEIAFDRRVVEETDSDYPGLLPRRAVVAGWRDAS